MWAMSPDSEKEEIPEIIGYRRTNHADIPRICQMMREKTSDLFGDLRPGQVFERACLSMVQINDAQEVVSNVSLCNFPNVRSVPANDWLSWITMHYGLTGVMERNTLFIHLLVWDDRYSDIFYDDLLKAVFAVTTYCLHVILVMPPRLETEMTELFERNMKRVVPKGMKCSERVQMLYLSLRQQFNPKLNIRRVVEEDNDDLIPIIDTEAKRLKELYGEFYISEIIRSSQNTTRQLIVGECENIATGVMCLTRKLDVDLLVEHFELGPYNYFCKLPVMDDLIPESFISLSASSAVNKTASDQLLIDDPKDRDKVRFSQAVTQIVHSESDMSEEDASDFVSEHSVTFRSGLGSELNIQSERSSDKRSLVTFESRLRTSIFAEAINEMPTRSLVSTVTNDDNPDADMARSQISKIIEGNSAPESYRGEVNAFTIELLSMDERVNERCGKDYLEAAFEVFPDLDYCVMLLPTTDAFFPFLEHFVRVPLRYDKDFPMVLYVAHRATQLGLLQVREAQTHDRENIESFLQGIPKKDLILEDFDLTIQLSHGDENKCCVFLCENEFIGIAIVCREPYIDELQMLYNIQEYISAENTPRDSYAQLLHFILVPIFSVHHRFFFRELMSLTSTTVLYYRLYESETTTRYRTRPLITCLDAMIPVKSRIRIHHPWPKLNERSNQINSKNENKFSLFMMTPRFAMMPKTVVNAKIVVDGASDCGVAFAEFLALQSSSSKIEHFTNLTIVSPNGLPYEQKETLEHVTMIPFRGRYCYAHGQVVPSRVWINVVRGMVSHINRTDKYVTVSGLGTLSYDYLILTCGLQYQTPKFHQAQNKFGKQVSLESTQEVPLNFFTINDDTDASTCLDRLKELTKNFTNKKSIVLYGHNIACYSTLQTLLNCGAISSRLVLIQPKLRPCENQSEIFFEDEELTTAITKSLCESGIKILSGFDLKDWMLEAGNELDRSNFIKTLRIESNTEKKLIACDALINFDEKSIPMKTFLAISRAGLVFDGRVVIDEEYRTNDPCIFAAGTITKYSRKYHAENWQQEFYNSIEVGERLAKNFKQMINSHSFNSTEDPSHENFTTNNNKDSSLPVFRAPIVVYCYLPGGFHYLDVRKPGKRIPRSIAIFRGTYGDVLVTGSPSTTSEIGYFRLRFNQYNRIETLTCYSKQAFRIQELISLYGKHDSLLNNLKIRFQNSLVADLYAYFDEPWTAALFHDRFDCLRVENRAALLSRSGINGESLVDDIIKAFIANKWKELTEKDRLEIESKYAGSPYQDAISSTLINFLQSEDALLPMYYNPRKLRHQMLYEIN